MLDAFTNANKVTKSYTLVENTPTWFDVLVGHLTNIITKKSKTYLKPGRPIGSRDTIPWKRKKQGKTYEKSWHSYRS